MRDNKFHMFYFGSALFVVVIALLAMLIKIGIQIGGNLGSLIVLTSALIIVVGFIAFPVWYLYLTKFKN